MLQLCVARFTQDLSQWSVADCILKATVFLFYLVNGDRKINDIEPCSNGKAGSVYSYCLRGCFSMGGLDSVE